LKQLPQIQRLSNLIIKSHLPNKLPAPFVGTVLHHGFFSNKAFNA
jgi:hypothetical protein